MKKAIKISKELINGSVPDFSVFKKQDLEPFKTFTKENGLNVFLIADVKTAVQAEIHEKSQDLFFCIDGEVEFIYGGNLVNSFLKAPGELRAESIEGGEKEKLGPGDFLLVPAGVSHQHKSDSFAKLLVVKIPENN